ncbi:HNH endonuclease [Serratia nevei]|uniref:HNH endonuclease n=1 Tax=Serratia nevei TaxID=2703794 RepID=UPI002542C716|nr:HNH endonuclease [Serratia nevei]EMB4113217.1 HNH endonuclease [Serratia marcescens]WIJ63286.1 HNH endonuclease [Serratia nevei]WIJ63395.1 HNH endonuclease [Serratia nevei]
MQILWLKENCSGNTYREITEALNHKFGCNFETISVLHKIKALGLGNTMVLERRYTEVQLSFMYSNKHLTYAEITERFNRHFMESKNVASIRTAMKVRGWGKFGTPPTKNRRILIDKKLVRLDVYVWECVNGPLPPGYTVIHLDNDDDNNQIDNLKLAPLTTKAAFVRAGYADAPKALAPGLYAQTMLKNAIRRIEASCEREAR